MCVWASSSPFSCTSALLRSSFLRSFLPSFLSLAAKDPYPSLPIHSQPPNSLPCPPVKLGNYLGALSNWTALQASAAPQDSIYYSIVGLHAITIPQDPKKLLAERRDMMASLLACGIDPERSCLFHQDMVRSHSLCSSLLSFSGKEYAEEKTDFDAALD
jgi:hypothetical protein